MSTTAEKSLHTQKLTFDTELKLSNEQFKCLLQENSKPNVKSKIDRLKTVPPFPYPYVFVKLSSASYIDKLSGESEKVYEERTGLPTGWKVLTTSHNNSWLNGYFGGAYYNANNKQIIIAHRGTDPKNVGSLRSDFQGIFENSYVPQMNSACTFAHIIYSAVRQIEDFDEWQLFFTGHSLGAWLAQVTTFSVKYLKGQENIFIKNLDQGYHVHTEVFDSPGCKDMLLKLATDFGIVYNSRSKLLDTLDMISYLSSPNLVNCCNYHTGTLYRIYPKVTTEVRGIYTLTSHSIFGILDAFDPITGQVYRHNTTGGLKMKSILDWPKLEVKISLWNILDLDHQHPVLGIEYVDFFKWANTMNDFDPEPDVEIPNPNSKSTFEILYKSKIYREYEFSTTVFTQSEMEFLRAIQSLGTDVTTEFEVEEVTNDDISYILEQLRKITLEETVVFSREDNLRFIIPFVKTLLRIAPDLKKKVLTLYVDTEESSFYNMLNSCAIV